MEGWGRGARRRYLSIYLSRVLGFSRIYVQHRRWDFHEDAGVKSGTETQFFQTFAVGVPENCGDSV